jgi:hypothetical protein
LADNIPGGTHRTARLSLMGLRLPACHSWWLQVTAIATAAPASFAIITDVFAVLAFRKQSAEIRVLGRQLEDQQAVTGQQAKLLEVQSAQLDVQRQQLEDQCKINEKQAEVAELQAQELRESLDERKRDREQRRRDQATRVFSSTGTVPGEPKQYFIEVMNASDRPVYNLTVTLHGLRGAEPAMYSLESEPSGALMPGSVARIPAKGGSPVGGTHRPRACLVKSMVPRRRRGELGSHVSR